MDIALKATRFCKPDTVCLVAADQESAKVLEKMHEGESIHVKGSRQRNPGHHRKAFALLNEVYQSQTYYATLEDMLDDIKISIGHCKKVISLQGGVVRYIPKSINWGSMDQTTFEQFYDKMVNFIISEIIPLTKSADLERRVYEILGEPGPQQLER